MLIRRVMVIWINILKEMKSYYFHLDPGSIIILLMTFMLILDSRSFSLLRSNDSVKRHSIYDHNEQ